MLIDSTTVRCGSVTCTHGWSETKSKNEQQTLCHTSTKKMQLGCFSARSAHGRSHEHNSLDEKNAKPDGNNNNNTNQTTRKKKKTHAYARLMDIARQCVGNTDMRCTVHCAYRQVA